MRTCKPRTIRIVRDSLRLRVAALLLLALGIMSRDCTAEAQSVVLKQSDILLACDELTSWKEGEQRFFLLQKNCFIEQGLYRIRAEECLAWMREPKDAKGSTTVELLATGNVRLEGRDGKESEPAELRTTLTTTGQLKLNSKTRVTGSAADHPLYAKAFATPPEVVAASAQAAAATANSHKIQQAQFATVGPGMNMQGGPVAVPANEVGQAPTAIPATEPQATDASTGAPAGAPRSIFGPGLVPSGGGGARRVRVFPRSSLPFHSEATQGPTGEQIFIFTGGINLIVEELATGMIVDIAADRVVLWTRGGLSGELQGGGANTDGKQPFEAYLEGNVYIRQGNPRSVLKSDSVVLAGKQVYFNVNTNQALVLDGSVETYDDKFGLPLFMRSEQIRQLSPQKFYADRASVTSSVYRGTPGYAFTSRDAYFEEVKERIRNPFTRSDVIDPVTGEPMIRTKHYATTYNNILRINDFPVFYWPYLRLDVEDPLGPLEQIQVGNTNNLGFTTTIALDIWDLIGLDYLPIAESSSWLGDIGYYSKRGIAGGSRFNHYGDDLFGIPGQYYGNALTWWIDDHGTDNLGIGRSDLVPPDPFRGRSRFQHHQTLPNDFTVIAETSYLSDSNVLESFFEVEYDTGKDQETLLYVKQQRDNWAWTGLVQPRLMDFLPQNAFLPRLDGYLLGVPLWDNRLTYHNHSSITYAELLPPDQYQLPTDVQLSTGRFDTRNEIDLPLTLGPWQVTPFVVGQFTGYTETIDADALGRVYAAGGVRTSLPFWKLYPGVHSELLNLSGIAHKIEFNVDYLYGWANRSYLDLPTLDQVDDDTTDLVRRQNLLREQAALIAEYGTSTPQRYDPRFIALRQNVFWLPDILDDMENARFSINQRLQTKRGPAHNQRIIDWMVFDVGTTIFPDYNRDNFGALAGLVTYKYLWNIGDRTAYQSNILYEPLDDSVSWTNGFFVQRPPRTNLGFFYNYSKTGPFDSSYIGAQGSYRFSKKYAGMAAVGTNLAQFDQVSYQLGLTRVGLDFVTTLAVVLNAGRDDFGLQFEVIPRAQARTRIGRAYLQTLPFGVEPSENAAPILEQSRVGIINNYGNGGF